MVPFVKVDKGLDVAARLLSAAGGTPARARVVALSGGYDRREAFGKLVLNHGLIGSFSRALLQDLRYQMPDAAFNAALGSAADEIYQASVNKL